MTATMQIYAEGTQFMLGLMKGSSAIPANYYMMLVNFDGNAGRPGDAAPAQTLAGVIGTSEVPTANTAYARQAVTPASLVISASGSYFQWVTPQRTFGPFGGSALPTNATHVVFVTSSNNSGVAIAAVPLNALRIYNTGDQELITFSLLMELGT